MYTLFTGFARYVPFYSSYWISFNSLSSPYLSTASMVILSIPPAPSRRISISPSSFMNPLYTLCAGRVSPVPNCTLNTCRLPYTGGFLGSASKLFLPSMAFAHQLQARLPLAPLNPEPSLYNAAEFTLCYDQHSRLPCLISRYVILPLGTLHFCSALGFATRLLGDYRDRTSTG